MNLTGREGQGLGSGVLSPGPLSYEDSCPEGQCRPGWAASSPPHLPHSLETAASPERQRPQWESQVKPKNAALSSLNKQEECSGHRD